MVSQSSRPSSFKEYSKGARIYALEIDQLPEDITFDPVTATANISYSRCPATRSDDAYTTTHFFRPIVNFATVHHARLTMQYYAARMMIAYLQQLTVYLRTLT
ncbi:hypothetical protein V1505DRAFT_20146 [Lipomyces doorenjongii]